MNQINESGKKLAIWGMVCAVISLVVLPPVFGLAGIILGTNAMKQGEKQAGLVTVILSSIFMLFGMAFGIYVQMNPEFIKL